MGNIHEFSVTPFSLPLNRDQFASALRVGHGRAVMHVRRHGIDGLEDLLIDACMHNRAYDPQCEGSRKQWLVGMLDLAGIDEEQLLPILLRAMKEEDADYYTMAQRTSLVGLYALRGNQQAKEAIYAAADAQMATDEQPDCAMIEAIIKLDDLDGLCYIAERSGRWLAANKNAFADDYLLFDYDQIHGKGQALKALRAAAADNNWIAVYLDRLDANRKKRTKHEQRGSRWTRKTLRHATADDVINSVETGRPELGVLDARRWGRETTDDNIRRIAERLFATSDAKHLATYLRILDTRVLPEFDERLLSYIDHPNERIRSAAVRVLANNRHPIVRELAFERLRRGGHAERALQFLINNYQPGDWQTIRKSLHLSEDDVERHETLFDLPDIFKANPLPEAFEPLLLTYEYQPCSICRTKAVEQLVKLDLAPTWLIEEYKDDSYRTDDNDGDGDGVPARTSS